MIGTDGGIVYDVGIVYCVLCTYMLLMQLSHRAPVVCVCLFRV